MVCLSTVLAMNGNELPEMPPGWMMLELHYRYYLATQAPDEIWRADIAPHGKPDAALTGSGPSPRGAVLDAVGKIPS